MYSVASLRFWIEILSCFSLPYHFIISKVSIHRLGDQRFALVILTFECSAEPTDIAISGYKVLVVDSGSPVGLIGLLVCRARLE